MLSILFAAIGLEPIVHLPMWLIVFFPILFLIPMLIAMMRAIAQSGQTAEPTPNECWKGGIIYYNPNDPALLVEKRTGPGYTFNFGNRWSWLLASGVVVIIASTFFVL
ncbi:MAG: DUF5808 domain-containing protein [Bryobacteraceae bacterium]